jgi:hypothetical protein
MREGNLDGDLDEPIPTDPESQTIDAEPPVNRFLQRVNRSLGGRPPVVYFVLVAGGLTLLILLAIVWLSATGDSPENLPICTAISADESRQLIFAGEVERLTVLVDEENPLNSLTGMRLDLTDGGCRQPQQGADARADLFYILGAVEFYNTFGEQRVSVNYQRQKIDNSLLSTSTPTPTATLPPTETPTPAPTLTPTETPPATPEPTAIETPTALPSSTTTATVTATATKTLDVVEAATPNATPELTRSATATNTAALTPTP